MVHITSLVAKMQFNHLSIISLWELSVAMATKPRGRSSQFLLFLKAPNQATFLPSYGQIASMALKELSFESVNGWTTGRRRTKSDHYSSYRA